MENMQVGSLVSASIINKVIDKRARVVLDRENGMVEQSFLFPKAVALFDLILEKLGLESFTFTTESITNYLKALEDNSKVIQFTEEEHLVVLDSLNQCKNLNLPDDVKSRIDLMSVKLKLIHYTKKWIKGEYQESQPVGEALNNAIIGDNCRNAFAYIITVKVDDAAPQDAATFLGISQNNKSKSCKDMTIEQFAYSVASTQGSGNSETGFKAGSIFAGLGVMCSYHSNLGGISAKERQFVINNDENSDSISVTQTTFFEFKPAGPEHSQKSVKCSLTSTLFFSKTKLNDMLELYKTHKQDRITLAKVNELVTSRELTKIEGLTLDVLMDIKKICDDALMNIGD